MSKTIREAVVGDKFKCVNGSGWGFWEEGDVLVVTELWLPEGVDLNGKPAATLFAQDFEFVEGDN